MKLLLAILISLSLANPASASDDWDYIDKSLLGILVLSHTIDCFQTRYIFDDPNRGELNPIIRNGVNEHGIGFVPVYFLASTLIGALIADWMPSDYRKPWLGIWVGSSLSTTYRNHVLGVRLRF